MKVVIGGARFRSEAQDLDLVNELIDQLKDMYPPLQVMTTSCERGVGKIVKNRLMPKDSPTGETEIPVFSEVKITAYGKNINKHDYSTLFRARNHMLLAWGEEFHIFLDNTKSAMTELVEMVREAGLPLSVYYYGEITEPKLHK